MRGDGVWAVAAVITMDTKAYKLAPRCSVAAYKTLAVGRVRLLLVSYRTLAHFPKRGPICKRDALFFRELKP